jgi:DNA-binding transcriptional LysR family regulator
MVRCKASQDRWMDLRQLRYFVAVAEAMSFTVAARNLNISQPPLSMHIRALEDALGTRLFDRTHRSITLTEAGVVFLEQARLTLSQMESAVRLTKLAGQGETGLLRIAFTNSVPLIPGFAQLIRRFRRQYPLARLEIVHMPTGPQLRALEDRSIDIGLMRPAPQFQPPAHLRFVQLWNNELRVVMPTDHPLAALDRPLAITELADEPLILFPRDISCGLHEQITQLFNDAGTVPNLGQEAREAVTIVGLVAAGVGISLLPDVYASLQTTGIHYARLAAPTTNCPLYLAHHNDTPTDLATRFVALAHSDIASASLPTASAARPRTTEASEPIPA